MVRKMSNLKIIIFTFLISLILLVGASFIDIYKTHKNLQELIDLNYLKEEVNPLTKMYYSKKSYVTKENDTYTFYEVD